MPACDRNDSMRHAVYLHAWYLKIAGKIGTHPNSSPGLR